MRKTDAHPYGACRLQEPDTQADKQHSTISLSKTEVRPGCRVGAQRRDPLTRLPGRKQETRIEEIPFCFTLQATQHG